MFSQNKWYGWIPTLTGNIFLSNPFQDKITYKPLGEYSEKIPRAIIDELN